MSNIKSYFKEHPLVFTCIYTVVYFALFSTLEKTLVPKYTIHCAIDDHIPFNEYFIIAYVLWFLFVPFILFYLMANDRDAFWKMAAMMFTGNMICLFLYVVFPNRVLPKAPVANENLFCSLVNFIYYTDTPTNVCPSIHVLDTLAAHIAFIRSKPAADKPVARFTSGIYFILVCISTVSLKQHSIIDVFAALALTFVLSRCAYGYLFREQASRAVRRTIS